MCNSKKRPACDSDTITVDHDFDEAMKYFSEGVTDNNTKDVHFAWDRYCAAFATQTVYRDEPCTHPRTVIVARQNRSADEMESISTTCLLCGKISKK